MRYWKGQHVGSNSHEVSLNSETREALFFGGLILVCVYASCSPDSDVKSRIDALDSRLSGQAEVVDYINSRLFELERAEKKRSEREPKEVFVPASE